MVLSMQDTKPVGLCMATQELFDTKRYLLNFCDGFLLRGKDQTLNVGLSNLKKELNTFRNEQKFIGGHKAVIINNIDKIISSIDRYAKDEPVEVDDIKRNAINLVKKLLEADNFESILKLESEFKSKITLPVYQLYINDLKRSGIKMV